MEFKINNVEIFVALTIILSIIVTVLVAIEALDVYPQKKSIHSFNIQNNKNYENNNQT